jgi:hypothetical protein
MRASLSAIQWESELLACSLIELQTSRPPCPPSFHFSRFPPCFSISSVVPLVKAAHKDEPPAPNQCKQPGSNIDTVGRQQEQSCRHSSDTWIFADPSFKESNNEDRQRARCNDSDTSWLSSSEVMRRQQHEDLAVTLQIHDLCRSKPSKQETMKTDRQPGARTLTLLEHRHHLKWEGSSNKPLPSLFRYIDLCRSKLILCNQKSWMIKQNTHNPGRIPTCTGSRLWIWNTFASLGDPSCCP